MSTRSLDPTPRYDDVEGRSPSAETLRASTYILLGTLTLLGLMVVVASVTLCVVAGFGVELIVGSVIALAGMLPIALAAWSRKPHAVVVPAHSE